jgi:hypothetical protein
MPVLMPVWAGPMATAAAAAALSAAVRSGTIKLSAALVRAHRKYIATTERIRTIRTAITM